MRKLELSNKRVCKFYEENPTINFEAVNLIFVDLFEKLCYDMNHTMTTTINSELLTSMHENTNQISEIKQSILKLTDSVSHMNTEIISNIMTNFIDIKKEYIEDVKNIIQTNTFEKVGPLLEKNNNILIDKTTLIMSDVVPRNQNQYFSQINDSLKTFSKSIMDDTQQLLKTMDTQSIKEFITNFDMKSSLMLQNVQQPIYSFISASEDRINTNINILKDGNSVNQITQTKIMNELGEIFNKFRDTTVTQQHSDKQLSNILTKLYNSAEIQSQNPMFSSNTNGVLMIKRQRKTNILVENKDTEQNVSIDDVHSFLLSIEEHNCNGIFISQRSGIATKKNYQIELHNNNVIVFVHNTEYSPQKIEVAVDIIDNLSTKLRQFKTHNEADCTIPKDILDTINNEYQMFLTQKNAVVDVFKESQKKVLAQIDEIRFPSLDKYLATKYSAPIQKPGLKCELCKSFSGNNLKALAAHKRGCVRKNTLVSVTGQ